MTTNPNPVSAVPVQGTDLTGSKIETRSRILPDGSETGLPVELQAIAIVDSDNVSPNAPAVKVTGELGDGAINTSDPLILKELKKQTSLLKSIAKLLHQQTHE